jgi:NADPH-dependent 2,4-dienoyl-CoA reductase/sulfur reductase-like enzyme
MMQERQSYVIVGSGIAGCTAAETLREEDSSAKITVITDDPFPLYYRPALKDYLAGRIQETKLWARGVEADSSSADFYERRQIQILNGRVVDVSAREHIVQLHSGQRIEYSHLLLASGAQASTLSCPGIDLAGVTTLRTVADYRRIINYLDTVRRVVVSGSGTLALETIETLRHRGHQVTHLVRHQQLWSEVLDQTASDLVLQQERRDGVDVRLEDEITEICGQECVKEVRTKQGARIVCEMVIIAIGIEPNLELAKQSNIDCGRGVKVNDLMRTSDAAIYAAGDIVETTDPHTGRVRLLGQWYPAIQQARAAAYAMMGILDIQHPFNASTFYNATFLYQMDFACAGLTGFAGLKNVSNFKTVSGLTNVGDGPAQSTGSAQGTIPIALAQGYQEIVADPEPRMYRKVILKDGIAVGMLALGDRSGTMEIKRAIDHRVNLLPVLDRLFARDFVLRDWLDQQGVPPPWPGVKRSGEVQMQQTVFRATGTYHPVLFTQPKVRTEGWLEAFGEVTLSIPGVAHVRLSSTKVMTIGRRQGLYLCIDHASVSRNHAEIRYMNGQYILHDLGSKNGTSVNGQKLTSGSTYILKPQDYIQFGKYITFLFQERLLKEEQT